MWQLKRAVLNELLWIQSRFSRVWLFATPWTIAHQASLSVGFSRQEHWSGLPFPSPMYESEKWKWSRSVVSYSWRPHGLQPTRLLCPWGFPGKSTGVGCHCLLHWWWLVHFKRYWMFHDIKGAIVDGLKLPLTNIWCISHLSLSSITLASTILHTLLKVKLMSLKGYVSSTVCTCFKELVLVDMPHPQPHDSVMFCICAIQYGNHEAHVVIYI